MLRRRSAHEIARENTADGKKNRTFTVADNSDVLGKSGLRRNLLRVRAQTSVESQQASSCPKLRPLDSLGSELLLGRSSSILGGQSLVARSFATHLISRHGSRQFADQQLGLLNTRTQADCLVNAKFRFVMHSPAAFDRSDSSFPVLPSRTARQPTIDLVGEREHGAARGARQPVYGESQIYFVALNGANTASKIRRNLFPRVQDTSGIRVLHVGFGGVVHLSHIQL
jgi:hypothetical protein